MTSATLYREGADLDELLADLDAEHPGLVRVVDVSYGRDGGVMGFFARRTVGVHYVLDGIEAHGALEGSAPRVAPTQAPTAANPLDALLRAAEAAEMVESGRIPAAPATAAPAGQAEADGPTTDNVEFARLLLDIAAEKAARRAATTTLAPVDAPGVPPISNPIQSNPIQSNAIESNPTLGRPSDVSTLDTSVLAARIRRRPIGAHRAAEADPAQALTSPPIVAATPAPPPAAPPAPNRTPYTLRRQLVELGVPVAWVPEDDANAYQVVERLVRSLTVPEEFEPEPGQILAVVGPATVALAEAERLCARLRIDRGCIATAGCGPDPITHRRQAASLARQVRLDADRACVVVVATDATADGADPTGLVDQQWAADIVTALAPDHTLAVVDATAKAADVRALFASLGGVSSVAVVGAARTASPAALWQLEAPVAIIDGRRATRGTWAALLIDRLADLDA